MATALGYPFQSPYSSVRDIMDYCHVRKESSRCKELESGRRSEKDLSFYDSELEEGEIREDKPAGSVSHIHQECRALKGQTNVSHPPPVNNSSNKKRKQKEHDYYSYSDCQWALNKIEKVCSRRLIKLLSWHNGDRKVFNAVRKKQELEFFQEHAHSYKVHHMQVIPTIKYHTMKLPNLQFSILRKTFRKHFQSQLIEFVKRQITDRNKEMRVRERWIFEAKAGYLKKDFYVTPLSYSGFKIQELKTNLADCLHGDEPLNYFNMEYLSTEIEAIASSTKPEKSHAGKRSDASGPVLENSQSLLEINGFTDDGVSVVPTTSVLGQNNGIKIAFSAAAQDDVGHRELSCASRSDTGAVLEHANAVAADSGHNPPLPREKQRLLSSGNDITQASCSGSLRKFPFESAPSFQKTALHHEEALSANHHMSLGTVSVQEAPSATLPSTDVTQIEQSEDICTERVLRDRTSSFSQVTEQPDMQENISMLDATQQQYCHSTCQAVVHRQPPDGNTHSVGTESASSQAPDVQLESTNQILTGSMFEQCPTEVGFESDPVAVELSRLQMLRVLIAKRHEEKMKQLLLAREIEMAQAKRKFDELVYKSEMETLLREKELSILYEKVYKQHMLAERFQDMLKTASGVGSHRPGEPNQSSGQQGLLPVSVSAPCISNHVPFAIGCESSMGGSLRHPSTIRNHATADSLGRYATALVHSRSTEHVYHAPAPHLRAVINPFPFPSI